MQFTGRAIGSAYHQTSKERRIEPVIARRDEPATTRAVGALALCFMLLLASPGRPAAQDNASRLFPVSADDGWLARSETASPTRSSPVYRLLPEETFGHEPLMASADFASDVPVRSGLGLQPPTGTALTLADDRSPGTTHPASRTPSCPTPRLLSADSSECVGPMALASFTMDPPDQVQREIPRSEFLERHRVLFSTLIPATGLALVAANSLIGYDTDQGFRVHQEGWFGRNTTNGGADKASHLADYFIVASVFEDVYRMLGHSDDAALMWGSGLALATGLLNEVSDGFTRHGFSWEDFGMDAAGVAAAAVISKTHTRDLLGIRTSHIPGSSYTHDVYSADFKISGLGQRLGLNIGPLRWLLFSVTYGSKGYRVTPPIEQQRQVGFEIGLNLQQILNDLNVRRTTWWGYTLHLVGDNVRFPFTAVGMRYDMNHGKWHGPNTGNYD